MSCNFAIWYTEKQLTDQEALQVYEQLCNGDTSSITPNPAVDALYAELTSKHPEIDDVPEEEIDNTDLCPWSIAFDRSPGHIICSCVWSKAEYVYELLAELAGKHNLSLFDPQSGQLVTVWRNALSVTAKPVQQHTENRIIAPEATKKPWWKIW